MRLRPGAMCLVAALLPACALAPAGGGGRPVLRDHVFAPGSSLEGTVVLAGSCLVPRGATLTILPGARLLFVPGDADGDGIGDAALRVEGTLVAEGRPDAPVVFSSAAPPGRRRPGDWDSLRFDFSRGNRLAWTVVEYSSHSIHAHFSDGTVANCLIRRNIDGCRLGGSSFVFEGNLVRDNGSKGLNFRDCRVTLKGNEVTANGNGIFLFEKDGGSTIAGNNIHGNLRHDLRLDDFFTADLVLGENWWGTADPAAARGGIYDSRLDPELGTVTFAPAAAPFPSPRVPDLPDGEGP